MKKILYSALMLSLMAGCFPKAEMDLLEVKERQILVWIEGEPKGYVWSTVGAFGSGLAFGLVGVGAHAVLVLENGHRIKEAAAELDIGKMFSDEVSTSLSNSHPVEIIRFCTSREEAQQNGCVVPPVDFASVKSQYPGQLMLVIKPYEMGIRDQKPYLAAAAGLLDIDSEKWAWQMTYALTDREVRVERKNWRVWKDDKAGLTASIEEQIKEISNRVSCTCIEGLPEKPYPVALLYTGILHILDTKKIMTPKTEE